MYLIAIILFAVLVACISLKKFHKNENAPVLTEQATLIKKEIETTVSPKIGIIKTFILIFDINGDKIECPVPSNVYNNVYENKSGLLTHQGTRFKCFEFDGNKIEKWH